ncbi:MAG: hypothetical protein EA416_14710, partial [Trueperaceae bacterium]
MTTYRPFVTPATPERFSPARQIVVLTLLLVLVPVAFAQLPDPDIDLTWPDDAAIAPEAFFDAALPDGARDLAPGTGVFTLDGRDIDVVPITCRIHRRDSRTDLMLLVVEASNPSGARYPVLQLERDGTDFQAMQFEMRQNPEHAAFWLASYRGTPDRPAGGLRMRGEIGFDDVFVTADGRVWVRAVAERYDGPD